MIGVTEPEYIITEGRLRELEKNGRWDYLVKECRFRPYSPLTQDTTGQKEYLCDLSPSQCLMRQVQMEKIVRQDEREKANKIFDHTRALCDAIIEKLDCQSKLGFNAMLIKRDIESLRAGKDGEPELKDMTIGTSGANR